MGPPSLFIGLKELSCILKDELDQDKKLEKGILDTGNCIYKGKKKKKRRGVFKVMTNFCGSMENKMNDRESAKVMLGN